MVKQELPPRVNCAVENELLHLEEGEVSSSECGTPQSRAGARDARRRPVDRRGD
ncbi:hypothetical protein PF003_g40584 [Phytophthora fragariae]|nr:hypothetical protein PF003_g40584 [Phytophthora fragariae]